jgi:hypothetical protein
MTCRIIDACYQYEVYSTTVLDGFLSRTVPVLYDLYFVSAQRTELSSNSIRDECYDCIECELLLKWFPRFRAFRSPESLFTVATVCLFSYLKKRDSRLGVLALQSISSLIVISQEIKPAKIKVFLETLLECCINDTFSTLDISDELVSSLWTLFFSCVPCSSTTSGDTECKVLLTHMASAFAKLTLRVRRQSNLMFGTTFAQGFESLVKLECDLTFLVPSLKSLLDTIDSETIRMSIW